jgi:hypothetical protein
MRTSHRNAIHKTFDDVKDRIKQLVKRENHRKKTDEAIDKLKERYKVVLHEENLKDVVIDLSGGFGSSKKRLLPKH